MTRRDDPRPEAVDPTFAKRVMFVAVVAVLALLAWLLMDLFLLVFAAIVVAMALKALASRLERYLRVPPGWSVAAAVLLVVAALTGFGWVMGDPLAEQLIRLRERIPNAAAAVVTWLNSNRLGALLLEFWEGAKEADVPWAKLAGIATGTMGALGSALLIVFMAIFLAAEPRLYREGLLRLLPKGYRERTGAALLEAGDGLSRWLLGQSISMLFVGTATAIGLWLLDIPLALSVGVVCGLLAFVPFFGAIAGGLLAVLLAFVEGPRSALYVFILFVAIQQVEGEILVPLVQKWAVSMPPALAVAATIGFTILFGLPGALLATPLAVVAMILVRKLYVEEYLEQAEPIDRS